MTAPVPSKLTAERVETIFKDCLYGEGEDTTDHVKAPGITSNVGFHPGRLAGHKAAIEEMLDDLPDSFKKTGGGGMSFLSACEDRHGAQWTGFHQRMEQLFQLGVAVGKAALVFPREKWARLPGGMPYYLVN